MSHYKTVRINPDDFYEVTGKEKHEFELPFAEHMDLWVEWKANRDVIAWLYFTDGKRMPYMHGLNGHFSIRTQRLLSVVLESTKMTTINVCVQYKDLSVTEKADWTPVELTPPDPIQLKMSEAIQRELSRRGLLLDETLELEDEDNLEEDIPDDGFGEGFMEAEEPVPQRPRKRARQAPTTEEPRSGDAAGGDNGNPGGASDDGNAS